MATDPKMAERPPDVSETEWAAKHAYEAVQREQAADPETHAVRLDSLALEAAEAVRRGAKKVGGK